MLVGISTMSNRPSPDSRESAGREVTMATTVCEPRAYGITSVPLPHTRAARSRAREDVIRELDRRLETRRDAAS